MKEKFVVYPNLMAIEETLKAHQDYCVLAVSTTGLEETDEAIRVCMQSYTYDKDTQAYQKGLGYDVMVEANSDAVKNAIQQAEDGGYDCFASSGIDTEQYLNGINVQSKTQFQETFDTFITSLSEDALIIANNARHCQKFLQKLGFDGFIQTKEMEGKYLCQNSITGEYFSKAKIPYKNVKLETLRDTLVGGNQERGAIIGTENRLTVMNSFISKYGREILALNDEREEQSRIAEQAKTQELSQKGKEKYANASYEGKLNLLTKEIGAVNVSKLADRSYDCSLHRLQDVLERKHGEKGIIFMQVATTGFAYKGIDPHNDPIQFSAICCDFQEGKLRPSKYISFDIRANEKNIATAVSQRGSFDAFAYTGIDYGKYQQGLDSQGTPLKSKGEAEETILAFFKKHEDYAIVTAGTDKQNPEISFCQGAFENNHYFIVQKNASEPEFHFPISEKQKHFIDFTQFIKEHLVATQQEGISPAFIDVENWKGKKFSLEEIANNRGATTNDTLERCKLMVACTVEFLSQQKELYPEIYQKFEEVTTENAKPIVKPAEKINNVPEETYPEVPLMQDPDPFGVPEAFQPPNSVYGRKQEGRNFSPLHQETLFGSKIPQQSQTEKRERDTEPSPTRQPRSSGYRTRDNVETEQTVQKLLKIVEKQTENFTEMNVTNLKAMESMSHLAETTKAMTQTYALLLERIEGIETKQKVNEQTASMSFQKPETHEPKIMPSEPVQTESEPIKYDYHNSGQVKSRLEEIMEELNRISENAENPNFGNGIQKAVESIMRAERLLDIQKKMIEQE